MFMHAISYFMILALDTNFILMLNYFKDFPADFFLEKGPSKNVSGILMAFTPIKTTTTFI